MARPRKPTKLLEISGAFKHDPNRRRPNEPQENRPLGDPPERMPVEALAFWRELVEQVPAGVLTAADRWCVELASRLMCKAASGREVPAILELAKTFDLGSDQVKALISRETISSAEWAVLRGLLGAMGMNPADRSKLSVAVEKPKNQFAALAEKARQARK
jgi:phage terminase small subunit